MSDSRISNWIGKQCPLAPARHRFRLSRSDGANEVTVVEIEKGTPASLSSTLEHAITSDLTTISGTHTYRLYALGADQSVLASLNLRAKGSAPDDGAGPSVVNSQLAKLVGDMFEAEAGRSKEMHTHVMQILEREATEIQDLRLHTARLTKELLDERVANARLEAGASGGGDEVTKHIINALQSVPSTIAYTIKLMRDSNSSNGKELPAGEGLLEPLKQAAKMLSDKEIISMVRTLIKNPDLAREIVSQLEPSSKAAVMLAVQSLAKHGQSQDSQNPSQKNGVAS